MLGVSGTVFGIIAVGALIVLFAAVFLAREDGHNRLAAALVAAPLAMVIWTGALPYLGVEGTRPWFYVLASVWAACMVATHLALTILIIRSERKGAAAAAFFLFPVFGGYMGSIHLATWAEAVPTAGQ